MFKVHENGKVYNVRVRGAYQHFIKSEKKLREVVDKSFTARYNEESTSRLGLFKKCELLGVLEYTCPEKR